MTGEHGLRKAERVAAKCGRSERLVDHRLGGVPEGPHELTAWSGPKVLRAAMQGVRAVDAGNHRRLFSDDSVSR